MSDLDESKLRRKDIQLRVLALPSEKEFITAQAKSTGLSVSQYLLKVGMGYQVSGILDHKKVEDLAKFNGDLGRFGGLLKLWLTDDPKANEYGRPVIRALLRQVEANQEKMFAIMQEVVTPRAKR